MRRSLWASSLLAFVAASTILVAAQSGGKPVSGGNPTPGTAQPDPPNLADRITLTGCLQPVPKDVVSGFSRTGNTDGTPDPNTPMDTRYVLTSAQRVDRLPAGTGGSELAKKSGSRSYRLEGLESQFSPFVNTKVEISGEVRAPTSNGAAPTLLVEFVQKLAPRC
jgi:hypothetical protein